MTSDEESAELLMPFVLCQSNGGPYDDAAFVAGYTCGRVDGLLSSGRSAGLALTVSEACAEQLDLIGMRHGYVMKRVQDLGDGWIWIRFWKAAA